MKHIRGLAAWLVLCVIVAVAPVQAGAIADAVDACFFRDLDGSGSQGDSANPGAAGEGVFAQAVTVDLVEVGSGAVTSATTDPATGCVEFPGLVGGTDYRLRASYPAEFSSSPTGGDTDFVPDPIPSAVGDPFTATYTFTHTGGAEVSVSGGVSGLPELSLGYFITPSGDRLLETGTAPFDTTTNCPTQVSGDDCGEFDDVVRTNDVTTVGYTITADNIPDGDTRPLDDVVLEQTITPGTGAVIDVPSLDTSCLVADVSPSSSILVNPTTGAVTVTCNLGSKDNGTSIVPMYIRTDGQAENGSVFTIDARVYTGDDRAQVVETQSILAPEDITVSAAPRFDITMAADASNPHNRLIYYQTTERVNPVTGITEYGVNYGWDVSAIYDGGTKGQAALDGPVTFSSVIPPEFAGWDIVLCSDRPYGAGNMPNADRPEEEWGDRGSWNCSADRADNAVDISITGVDTDGDPVPTEGTNGNDLSAGPFYAFAGAIRIWYPLSDFYRSVDPDWEEGDAPIAGNYPLSNLLSDFDPVDATGQSNFGDDEEPLGNNGRTTNVRIAERGGFSKHLGSYEWADARIPDGRRLSTSSSYPCSPGNLPQGALMAGQTQRCSSGDAPAQPGEKAHFWYWLRNDGTFPWPAETMQLCDAFDNSTMALTTWTGGEPVYLRTASIPEEAAIIEYATAEFGDDVAANDWTNQLAAVRNCEAPNNDWSTDPYSFDADPDASLDRIGMIRVRVDESVHPEVRPSGYLQVSFPVEIRDTFNGGPRDGEPIPVGTIMANNANRAYGSVPFSARAMNAETYEDSPWGERMFYNRHQVRVTKTASIDSASPTDDDLFNVRGSDSVVWWLQPSVTAVTAATASDVRVIDTLPAGVSFAAFCQARQTYPAGVALDAVTENDDGTTTIEFDLGDRTTNEPIGPIPICTTIDNFLDPGTDLVNRVEITSAGDVSPENARSAERTVTVVAAGQFQLVKQVDAALELQLDTQEFTIGWTNLSDDFDFLPPDVIDVWPYNGDATNPINQRTEFDSDFSGSYELTDWIAQPTTTLPGGTTETTGGTWHYSSDDPSTIPYDADAAANDLSSGSVNWCTQAEMVAGAAPCDFTFSDSTAARFVQSDVLVSKSKVTVDYVFQAGTALEPNAPADRYVNRFAARTDSVDDLIRSNEVLVQVLAMNLGDLVFLDADVDGVFTDGVDVPIPSTPVELWADDGAGGFVLQATTTTNSDGRYVFDNLQQGTYEVRIPDTEFAGGTLDGWAPTVSPRPADDDRNEELDQQGRDSGLGHTTSGPVTLAADTSDDPPIGQEPTGENRFNLGDPYTYDDLSNMSVDLGFRGDPDVQIVKEVCDAALGSCDLGTDPLDPADGWVEVVTVPFTDTARWRVSVINIGDEVLTGITVDDDIEDSCDRASGSVDDLGIGEFSSWLCATPDVVEDVLNTASVEAIGVGSRQSTTDADAAAAETPAENTDVAVTKFVEGDDAQTAPGIFVDPDSPVTFTYAVTTGEGNVPLRSVSLIDDNGTPADAGDDLAAAYVSGDTDGDDRLDLDETWQFELTGSRAVVGQYANWATVTATPLSPGASPITDVDPAHYYGVAAGIELEKSINGDDADTAPGVLVADGADLTFRYELRNTGNVAVTIVSLTDDAGTSGSTGDDWNPTFVSGDDDGDGALDIAETWIYTRTGETAAAGPYRNVADLIVRDPAGNELATSDAAHAFGAAPSIGVEKATNTIDADVDPVAIADGDEVEWTYDVVNTGNVAIASVSLLDDAGTPTDLDDDFFPTFVTGDANGDGLLDVDETWQYRATSSASSDLYRNEAVATGSGPSTVDAAGASVAGSSVRADDPSSYTAVDPAIDVIKATNGTDHATAPGASVVVGEAVQWTYTVTNPGNAALSDVGVTDDNGTPGDTGDDVVASYVSGDTDTDDLLDVDETWRFEASGTAIAGQYSNTAQASGVPPEVTAPDGSTSQLPAVTADDDDFYYGGDAAVDIVKSTNGVTTDTGTGPYVLVGDAVTWRYEVTNTGNVALTELVVSDDNGTPDNTADDLTATYLSGDENTDEVLDTDETWLFEAAGVATPGQYRNVAVVTGSAPSTTQPDGTIVPTPLVQDQDDDLHWGAEPSISISKTVNGNNADTAPGLLLPIGADVSWEYNVVNTGTTPLIGLVVTDDMGVAVTCPVSTLSVGASTVCTGTGEPATLGQYTNIGTASAVPAQPSGDLIEPFTPILDPATGSPVERIVADDSANHFGTGPAVEIEKQVCDLDNAAGCDPADDDAWTEVTIVTGGDTAVWRITVSNTGNVDLADIIVNDPLAPNCDRVLPLLAAGEQWSFTCSLDDVAEAMTNTAFVAATPVVDPAVPFVTDSDTAETVEPAELILEKAGNADTVAIGDRVTYTLSISNDGVSAAEDIEILDTLPPGLSSPTVLSGTGLVIDEGASTISWSIPTLPAGSTRSAVYSVVVTDTGSILNVAEVVTEHEENVLSNNIDTATVISTPLIVPEQPPSPLAFTGSNTTSLLAAAGLLLVAGGAMVLFGRRRSDDPA